MKKSVFLLLIVTAFILTSCSNEKKYSRYSMERLEEKKSELIKQRSILIGDAYLNHCNENDKVVFIFRWRDIKDLIEEDSTLTDYRNIFTREVDERWEFVESIKSWQDVEKGYEREGTMTEELTKERDRILDSLRNSDGPYNQYIKDLQDSLKVSNYKMFSYILNDYRVNDRLLPVNWIPEKDMEIITRYPEIIEIDDEIRKVEEAIEAKEIES